MFDALHLLLAWCWTVVCHSTAMWLVELERAYNFHAHAVRRIRHLLTTELALTLVCSLILSRLDYCNAVLHGASASSIQKLQCVQNTAARIVPQASRQLPSRPLLGQLHWLLVRQHIDYKLAVLTTRSDMHQLLHTSATTSDDQTSGIYTPPAFFNHTASTQTDYQKSLHQSHVLMLCSSAPAI